MSAIDYDALRQERLTWIVARDYYGTSSICVQMHTKNEDKKFMDENEHKIMEWRYSDGLHDHLGDELSAEQLSTLWSKIGPRITKHKNAAAHMSALAKEADDIAAERAGYRVVQVTEDHAAISTPDGMTQWLDLHLLDQAAAEDVAGIYRSLSREARRQHEREGF